MGGDALIGHSGFVGGLLARQHAFAACFNTSNIDAVIGRCFDLLVCAAAPGSMVTANCAPERDRLQIEALIRRLETAQARRVVLISSIAVLADFGSGADESTRAFQQDSAYGRNRRMLETFVEERFADSLVVRLPALFGRGLRKNFIFDLLNPVPSLLAEARLADLAAILDRPHFDRLFACFASDPETGMLKLDRAALDADPARAVIDEALIAHGLSAARFHNPQTTYQFYDMSRLWSDIGVALQAGLDHVHLVCEPLTAARIHRRLTGREMPDSDARRRNENMRTRHAILWGREGPYLEDAGAVLEKLAAFHASERRLP